MKRMLNKLGTPALARKAQKEVKGGIFVEINPCGNPGDYACQDVYLPVLCSDGNIYSNGCYASLNCQYNCVRWDGDLA